MSSLFSSSLVERQPLACRIFDQAVIRQRLSHAYLLTGHTTNDKYLLSRFLSSYLNCEQVDKTASGSCLTRGMSSLEAHLDTELPAEQEFCRNCRWIWAQAHPQAWILLSGEESKSGRITVEKARTLSLELNKESAYVRTIVIPNATRDCFHAPAANALLKTIEEPNGNSLFLLFAPDAASVPPTIVSRCQIVPFVQTSSSVFQFPSEDDAAQEELRSAISKYEIYPSDSSVSQVMRWASELELATGDEIDTHLLLDWIVFKKFEQLKDEAANDPAVSAYLDRLLSTAQTTKDQLDSYVQPRAAFESFALSLVGSSV
jgi:DNA polymerase III delta prime subunit